MKKIILVLLLTSLFGSGFAQTNVSGGIFSNTTWTLAGSPYIVVDTTVVFPGVTLTIEPGVVVKFDDHMYIEMRQATLVATGTITDSITFTSNNPAPTPGIWGHQYYGAIYFNGPPGIPAINYWNISYAIKGIETVQNLPYIKNSTFTYNGIAINSLTNTPVDSCVFKYNGTALNSISNTTLNFCTMSNNNYGVDDLNNAVWNNCTIDSNYRPFGGATGSSADAKFYNCSISYNHYGFVSSGWLGAGNSLHHCVLNNNTISAVIFGQGSSSHDTIIDCEIKYNGTGVTVVSNALITHCDIEYDTVGIKVSGAQNIFCNKICNNISYGLQMTSSANFNVDDNYWCTNDSAQIAAAIYDGYDNVNYGLVTFLPLDSTCYQSTGINEMAHTQIGFSIFPNPATSTIQLTFNTKHNGAVQCEIRNVMGEKVYEAPLPASPQRGEESYAVLDVSFLAKGIYVVRVGDACLPDRQGVQWENKKLVVE